MINTNKLRNTDELKIQIEIMAVPLAKKHMWVNYHGFDWRSNKRVIIRMRGATIFLIYNVDKGWKMTKKLFNIKMRQPMICIMVWWLELYYHIYYLIIMKICFTIIYSTRTPEIFIYFLLSNFCDIFWIF